MRKLLPYRLIVFTALQLAALLFLAWVVLNLLPVMVKTLFAGMDQWNLVSIAFCWAIQVGLVAILSSVRDFLQPIALNRMATEPLLPLKISWVMLALTSLWNYRLLISLLFNTAGSIGFFIIGQWLLLLLLLYFLTAIVAPMGSFRVFRLLFLHQHNQKRNFFPLSTGDGSQTPVSKTIMPAPIPPQAKPKPRHLGYPGWVWPFVWLLVFMMLDWMGCI